MLSHKHTSILTQLRTSHILLAKHQQCIRKVDSPFCPNCQQYNKMVLHFTLKCPAYQEQMLAMQAALCTFNISDMGPTAHNLSKLLNTPAALKPLFSISRLYRDSSKQPSQT
ncbi:hypothetical protein BYT27DRAFT_7121376 [Phlegmacium glaucopus]|nr:hypothetical protein BYT27DRAFT_7121376 [Phlegmacium glaucopus]